MCTENDRNTLKIYKMFFVCYIFYQIGISPYFCQFGYADLRGCLKICRNLWIYMEWSTSEFRSRILVNGILKGIQYHTTFFTVWPWPWINGPSYSVGIFHLSIKLLAVFKAYLAMVSLLLPTFWTHMICLWNWWTNIILVFGETRLYQCIWL